MTPRRRDLTLRMARWAARWLAPGREVRTLSDIVHIRSQLRLGATFLITVLLPGLLLAWTGFSSIRGEELAVWDEVQSRGELSVGTLVGQVEADFGTFEAAVRRRLESGRSPVEALGEISPNLRVAFRLDARGRVAAPFDRSGPERVEDYSLLLSPYWKEARAAEAEGRAMHAAALYLQAAELSRGSRARGQATFAHGRALLRAGEAQQAEQVFANVVSDFAQVRDLYGFRLGDLARLKRGESLLARDPEIGSATLEALVDELLASRWTIGEGGEAAVAARALELTEDTSAKDWLASTRGRLEERTRLLFYAQHLEDDLDDLTAGGTALRISSDEVSYQLTDEALWATLWWGEDFYALAMHTPSILTWLDGLSTQSSQVQEGVKVRVVSPSEAVPDGTLARRSLAPWLPGWSVVAQPEDPQGLNNERLRKRVQRGAVVLLAILMIVTGSVMTVRLVGRQLDVAREKADFAANVSHELRSPITQIRLKGEALQFGLVEDDEDLELHYDAIVRESERLSRLVDNVLDFAAIERGAKKYTLRPAHLGDTVQAAVDAARYSMETRGMVMDMDMPSYLPVVLHDSEAIAQVVQNLISNAAKYGRDGGWIGVQGRVGPQGVELKVSDRGIGIAASDLPFLFDRFYRSPDPEARRRKGTGIGLFIVHYIVEAHNGTISVQSTPGQGTTFTLHFPLTPPSPL